MLEDSQALLITLNQRLGFTLAAPSELIEELIADERFGRCRFLHKTAELCVYMDFEQSWSAALQTVDTAFEKRDIALLLPVGSVLGKSDLATQQHSLELISGQLERHISEVREQCAPRERLFYSLGALGGLALAVMLL